MMMNENDYIKREDAIKICMEYYRDCLAMHDFNGDSVADKIKTDIEALPATDIAHGSLKHTGSECSQRWICTNCNEIAYYPRRGIRKKRIFQPCGYKFCPNCSAKMDGKDCG